MFSYKEDTEDETDSDDIIEQDEATLQQTIEEDVETIEKVVRHRQGWPGRMLFCLVCNISIMNIIET